MGRGPSVWSAKGPLGLSLQCLVCNQRASPSWIFNTEEKGHLQSCLGFICLFCFVKPQRRKKYSSIDCSVLLPVPRCPHTKHAAFVAEGESVFIRVQSQFSPTLDKLFVELLYS